MNLSAKIPSVNYHLWKPCNMRCGFCFATFQDIERQFLPKGHLGRDGCLEVVESLARAGFRKINFAGGEPMLCPWLAELITLAKRLGMTTSVVTNGSRVTEDWLKSLEGALDWTALSVDSVDPATLLRTGRTTLSGPISEAEYFDRVTMLHKHGVRTKVNTVVTRDNLGEDLTGFILRAQPERWKLLQVLSIEGQNDGLVDRYAVSLSEFDCYVRWCRRVEAYGIKVVSENNEQMTGSYAMVDPAGRFFDNVSGAHSYSRPILDVGAEEAYQDVLISSQKFIARDGLYDW